MITGANEKDNRDHYIAIISHSHIYVDSETTWNRPKVHTSVCLCSDAIVKRMGWKPKYRRVFNALSVSENDRVTLQEDQSGI
jgi:hypothetical protein